MENKVLVETSARHVHLTEEAIAILFGEGAKLTPKKPLSQPGQFACEERVNVVGPKKAINNVIILGPARPECQIEVSLTDARVLGVPGMIRESGDVAPFWIACMSSNFSSTLLPEPVEPPSSIWGIFA